jgi:ABC-type transport system substrate-binding protein
MSSAQLVVSDVPRTARRSLRIGVLSAVGTLDPREAGDTITSLVLGQIFEGPYAMVPSGGVEPTLFDGPLRMDQRGSRPVYSAAVRPGIVFSDGTELTAEIAAASLSKAFALRGRATVSARDGRVVFSMSSPSPRSENLLSQWNTGLVLERSGVFYGTGPYQLPAGTTMQTIKSAGLARLERNPRYRGKAIMDELLFTIYPTEADGTPRLLIEAAKRGDIDLTMHLSVNDLVRHSISGYQPMMQPGNSTGILFFNCQRLNDLGLRRAIQHAIDPVPIAEISYEKNHFAFLAGDIIPAMMSKVTASTAMRDRNLLRKHPSKPASLTLVVPWIQRPYLPKPLAAAREIARQLGGYGIDIRLIDTLSSEHYFQTLSRGEYDLSLGGWVADNPDPSDFYDSLLSSAQVSSVGEYASNQARWADPATDAALGVYRADPTTANRNAISDLIENQAIMIPLIYGASSAVRSRKVKNFHIVPSGLVAFADVDTH